MLMLNKEIKTTKSILVFSILWLITFVLILQLATSTDIDKSIGVYLSTIFKDKVTAGGVLFGLILYPLYFLTYDVASYIILFIVLVIFTAFLIDKIYVDINNKKALGIIKPAKNADFEEDNETLENETEEETEEDESDEDKVVSTTNSSEDEDIFISDE